MLKIKNLNKSFGGLKAVNDVNLEVKKGSITGLISKWCWQNYSLQHNSRFVCT